MRLQFLNSIPLSVVSGGNIFNQNVIEGLRIKNIEVDYNAIKIDKHYDAVIIDSLCMNKIQHLNLINRLFA